VITVVNI